MPASEGTPKRKAKEYLPQSAEDLYQKARTLELAVERLYYAAEVLRTHGGTVAAFIKRVDEDIPRIVRFSAQCRLAAEDIEHRAEAKRATQEGISPKHRRK